MIYWDNAATTWPKPRSVRLAVGQALTQYGANPGRSGHTMAMAAARQLFQCRQEAAAFFGLDDPSGVIFTSGCTASLNMVIQGLLRSGGHAVISDLEHNAVRRPLAALGQEGYCYTAAAWDGDEDVFLEHVRRAIRPDTRLLVCTHASNVFGVTLPVRRLGELAHSYGLLFCVDAAQTAGVLPIHMEEDGIDFLCVAAHKGLYAPMGTGLLLCRNRQALPPLMQGGTGSRSMLAAQPDELPDRLESGTPNTPGILGLLAGLRFIQTRGRDAVYRHELGLLQKLYDTLAGVPGVRFYTPRPAYGTSAPVLSVNIGEVPSEKTAQLLNAYGIAVRAGLHCAPLAHTHFGTISQGTVRFAPSAFSNEAEIEKIGKVFLQIVQKTLPTGENML